MTKNTVKTCLTVLTLFSSLISFSQIPEYVPTDSLKAWWSFNGDANDESGYDNNGTVYGATLTMDRFGELESAYSFDGEDDYIEGYSPSLNFVGDTSFSIQAWILPSSIDIIASSIFRQWDLSPSSQQYGIKLTYDELYFLAEDGLFEVEGACITSWDMVADEWYQCVVTYDGEMIEMWINGVLALSKPEYDYFFSESDYFQMSSSYVTPFHNRFYGKLDDIGIWNRALTECEIKQLYHATLFDDDLSISEVTTSPELFGEDGSIDITISGGTPPYQLDWDNDGIGDFDDSEDLIGISGGTYIVIVNDDIGCFENETDTIIVSSQLSITESSTNEISIYPNPSSDQITIQVDGNFEYKLLTFSGETVRLGQATDKALVDILDIANGQYILEINYQNKKELIQLVKK
jgi:hypothetical protein